MIDCLRTENYFIEKSRMTKQQKNGICKLDCTDCPLSIENNSTGFSCPYFEMRYPEKAIEIVQKWSDEHPPKTYLSELLEHFPNVPLTATGIPEDICPFHLGFMSKDDCRSDRNCIKCWNQREEGE
jgi:hypothetical protein